MKCRFGTVKGCDGQRTRKMRIAANAESPLKSGDEVEYLRNQQALC